jgi:hypothetical protein
MTTVAPSDTWAQRLEQTLDQVRDQVCVMRIGAAGGEPAEVTCPREGIEGLAWTSDGAYIPGEDVHTVDSEDL